MSLEGGENPVKLIRRQNGLSQRAAAEKIGCHYQLVYMSEHGMYWRIPVKIIDWMLENSPYTRYEIEDSYAVFKVQHRKIAIDEYSLGSLDVDALGKPGENPIVRLRESLGLKQSSFCKALCIPVAVLYLAEHDGFLPNVLRVSLLDLSIPLAVIEEIDARFEIM